MVSARSLHSAVCAPAIALVLLSACSGSELGGCRGDEETAAVPVSLSLCIQNVSAETKTILGSTDSSCLENILVAQYAGTDSEAELTGVPTYLTSGDIDYSNDGAYFYVKLIPMKKPSTIFFIANSFDRNFVFPETIGELVRKSKPLTCENDLFGSDGENSYLIFSGWMQPDAIRVGDSFKASLQSNISQIWLNVTNSSDGPDKVTVKGVRLSSIPASSSYFPSFGDPSVFPSTVGRTISYDSQPWPSEIEQDDANGAKFTFYAPVNKRGSVNNSQESQKCRYNPGGATYAVVECTYYDAVSELDIPIEYNFFLGANMTDDFNIEDNNIYSFNIDIRSRGDVASDPRVKDFGTVDFTYPNVDRANCYLLNPPTMDSYWRRFLIPLDKINTFWGMNTSIYEKVEDNCLIPGRGWIAEVIWSDFTIDPSTNFRFAGGGASMSGTGPGFFEVQIPKGTSGNVLVGIRRDDTPGSYLWSYHLWITDYCPDDIDNFGLPGEGTYDYDVANGMVHRLPGDEWTSGSLRRSFIMDRNLGALSTEYASYKQPGCLFYEFGRKDPFWFRTPDLFPAVGTHVEYQSEEVMDTEDFPSRSIQYSVNHPGHFIRRSDMTFDPVWTVGNKYNPSVFDPSILWNDPYASPANHLKSFFDPCPSGWKVPETGVYLGLTDENFKWTTNGRKFNDSCFFPAPGFIASHFWGVSDVASYGLYHTSSPVSKIGQHEMWFQPDKLNTDEHDQRCYGFNVRCVKM